MTGLIPWRILLLFCSALMMVVVEQTAASGADRHRFFYEGNGQINLLGQKSGGQFNGTYRHASGQYDERAYKAICRVFGAPHHTLRTGLSLRLVAFLDYLEDRLGPGSRITITSGYRNPVYNTKLRQSGSLAAKASLHQYGMAADIKMAGVSSESIWLFVKDLGFGGTGYYHGETVHLDVGPARSWDETSSGVGTGLSDDNKLIGLVTDFDRYQPDEIVILRFIRMTAFPIGVEPEFVLQRIDRSRDPEEVVRFSPKFNRSHPDRCPQLTDITQMASIQWRLPVQLPPGQYQIMAFFCDSSWDEMPAQVVTPNFEIYLH